MIWVGVPVVWLAATGLVGTQLEPGAAIYGTVALFLLAFVGLPLTVSALTRAALGRQRRARAAASVRVRRPALSQMRAPALLEPPRPERAPIGTRRRAAALSVLALMFATGLAVWTAVPVGWLWLGSQLSARQQPGAGPYVLIVLGIPLTIALLVRIVYRLDGAHAKLTRQAATARAPRPWLKSLGAERQRRPWTAGDAVMTASVAVALLAMLIWFLLFADQHSLVESYLN
jgi:hypothetical protein